MSNRFTAAVANAVLAGCMLMAAAPSFSLAAGNEGAALPEGVFALVDGVAISDEEYQRYLVGYSRSKFYHGATPEKMEGLRADAGKALIRQRLLVAEAERRDIPGDAEQVEEQLGQLEARYKDSERWEEVSPRLPQIRQHLLRETKIAELKQAVRRVGEPDEQALSAYYQANLEKFTQPERLRLDILLLAVEPWQTAEVWSQARLTAEELHRRLLEGADFAALARRHSSHSSAEAGGDLGFVHKGMLAQPAQEAVDLLTKGHVTPPVRLLEGFAIFRLMDRQEPRRHPLAKVRDRAIALYKRDLAELQWDRFVASLWDRAEIIAANNVLKGRPE